MTQTAEVDVPPAKESSPRPQPPQRLVPGWFGLSVIVFMAAVIVAARFFRSSFDWLFVDEAVANLATLISGAIAVFTFWLWFVFRSTYSLVGRRIAFFALVGLVGGIVGTIRIDSVDGYMIPQKWRFAWQLPDDVVNRRQLDTRFVSSSSPAPTRESEKPVTEETSLPPEPVTKDDFTGFLGNERTNYIADAKLEDWPNNSLKELWRKPVGAGWCAFAVKGNRAVTMEQDADHEWTTCYDVRIGEPLWGKSVKGRHENPLGGVGPRSTPTIDGNYVYSLGATGVLQCLKLDSGEVVWTDDLLKRYYSSIDPGDSDAARLKRQQAAEVLVQWGYTSSPLIYENLVIVQGGGPVVDGKFQGKSLIAFDKLSGQVVWEGGDQQIAYVSPVIFKIDDKDQVVIVNEATITGHDPKTGETLWSFPWKGTSNQDANNSQPHLIGPNRIFISKGYFLGSAVFGLLGDESGKYDATEDWQNLRMLKTKFTNVTIVNGYAYGLSDGIMECGNLETGKSEWKSRKGNFGHGQVLGVGDRIIVLGEKGELGLIAADPKQYKELARFQALQGKTWNSICLAGKRLLIRNAEEAVCYELP